MSPRYSARAARALGYLKRRSNDIEVFVEDTGNRAMWMRLLRGALPSQTRLKSINMLGGRDAVEEACRIDQANDTRRRLYIIDADFDKLLGKRRPNLRHLYRIDGYCVENIFIRKSSALIVAQDNLPNLDPQAVESMLDFDTFERQCETILSRLFVTYAIAFSLERSIQTVGYPVLSLMAKGGGAKIDRIKVIARARAVRSSVIASVGITKYRRERNKVAKRMGRLRLRHVVSGKDYLMPILWIWLKTKASYRGTEEQLKVQLAKASSPQCDAGLIRALRAA